MVARRQGGRLCRAPRRTRHAVPGHGALSGSSMPQQVTHASPRTRSRRLGAGQHAHPLHQRPRAGGHLVDLRGRRRAGELSIRPSARRPSRSRPICGRVALVRRGDDRLYAVLDQLAARARASQVHARSRSPRHALYNETRHALFARRQEHPALHEGRSRARRSLAHAVPGRPVASAETRAAQAAELWRHARASRGCRTTAEWCSRSRPRRRAVRNSGSPTWPPTRAPR